MPLKLSVLAAGSFLLAACVSEEPHVAPTAPRQRAQTTGAGPLEEGRRLFELRCVGCHLLPTPTACTPAIMNAMAPQAALSAEERRLIETYLAVARR